MINRKTVLIVACDHNMPAENLKEIRSIIIDQINEGVLVIPSWCTATVANLDLFVPEPVLCLKESQPKKEEPKKSDKKPKKIDIDMGKVKALKAAGRSIEWIAGDMGVSVQTIYNRLKEEGEKNETN